MATQTRPKPEAVALLVERHVTQRESLLDRLVVLIRRILDAIRRGSVTRKVAAEQLSAVTASSQAVAAEMSQAFTRATFSLYGESLPVDNSPAFDAITTEDEWLTIIESFLDSPSVDDVVSEAEAIARDAVARASNAGVGAKGADFYRRIIHPELSKGGTCGLCIAAAHRKYRTADLKSIHDGCHCGVMAGTNDADPGKDLNDADLTAAYKAAGTTDGWTLKQVRFARTEDGDLEPVKTRQKRGKRKSTDGGDVEFAEATGLPEKSTGWLRQQIALTEATKPSDWRTSQLARLRAELGQR